MVLGAPVAMGTYSSCLFILVDQKTGMEEEGKPAVNLKFTPWTQFLQQDPIPKGYTTHRNNTTPQGSVFEHISPWGNFISKL